MTTRVISSIYVPCIINISISLSSLNVQQSLNHRVKHRLTNIIVVTFITNFDNVIVLQTDQFSPPMIFNDNS